MWTDGNGFFYEGDCRVGDRLATDGEVTAFKASIPAPAPTVEERLSAVEQTLAAVQAVPAVATALQAQASQAASVKP